MLITPEQLAAAIMDGSDNIGPGPRTSEIVKRIKAIIGTYSDDGVAFQLAVADHPATDQDFLAMCGIDIDIAKDFKAIWD